MSRITAQPWLEDLFKQLKEENPKADDKQFSKIFIDAVRDDPDLTAEVVDWFIERNFPAAKKNN